MSEPIHVAVDPTNPGQFFACCGLLELADRLWPEAEGWFKERHFYIASRAGSLAELLNTISRARLMQVGPDDDLSPPMEIGAPFDLRLDWWVDERAGGKAMKVWAGSMRSFRIARAMKGVLCQAELHTEALFDRAMVVYDPEERDKKVEPYYFDARRGANALALDIGFMPDALKMTTAAYPAVEFLCLVGLQRARPAPTSSRRVFDYFTWATPMPISLLPAATTGCLSHVGAVGYRFENAFRTDQKKHKAFLPSTPIGDDR
jgi:CRISPR-associated protein Csb3